MIEFLVEEMGYRAITLEAGFVGSRKINEFINGQGRIEDISRYSKSLLATVEESFNMFQWMKEYNEKANLEDRIRVYGSEGVFELDYGIRCLDRYLGKVDPSAYKNYSRLLTKKQS